MSGRVRLLTAAIALAAVSGPGMIAEAKMATNSTQSRSGPYSGPLASPSAAFTDSVESVIDMQYKRSRQKLIGYVDFNQEQGDVCDSKDAADQGGCMSPDEEECLADRKVTIYQVKKRETGDRLAKLGSLRTNGIGDWAARFNGRPRSGWYVSGVRKEAFSDRYGMLLVCTAAQSDQTKI